MPIYEYQCRRCGDLIERLQKMSDPPVRDCVACDGDGLGTMRRVLSAHVVGGPAAPRAKAAPPGCGRCGDPQGPCAVQ